MLLWFTLIVSKVDYCNSSFIGLPNDILKRVQSVLNRAARLIFNLPTRVPTTSLRGGLLIFYLFVLDAVDSIVKKVNLILTEIKLESS